MTESRRMELENVFHRSLIQAALEKSGGMTRKKLLQTVKDCGGSHTRFNLAMRWLLKNKVIWKVSNEYEMRTETAVL